MKWGRIDSMESSQRLLYWVLMHVVAPYFDDPLDHWLKHILAPSPGFGGDPGWEVECINDEEGEHYRVWADPDVSGLNPCVAVYDAGAFRRAARETLLALGASFPEKMAEIEGVLRKYGL